MVLSNVNTLRELRRSIGLKQQEFALLLQVPFETLRTWDSGRRSVPARIFAEAKHVVADRPRQTELLSLDVLARRLRVHARPLRAAARARPRMCGAANSASTNGPCGRLHGRVAWSWSSRRDPHSVVLFGWPLARR